jgi:hypothetical protein
MKTCCPTKNRASPFLYTVFFGCAAEDPISRIVMEGPIASRTRSRQREDYSQATVYSIAESPDSDSELTQEWHCRQPSPPYTQIASSAEIRCYQPNPIEHQKVSVAPCNDYISLTQEMEDFDHAHPSGLPEKLTEALPAHVPKKRTRSQASKESWLKRVGPFWTAGIPVVFMDGKATRWYRSISEASKIKRVPVHRIRRQCTDNSGPWKYA